MSITNTAAFLAKGSVTDMTVYIVGGGILLTILICFAVFNKNMVAILDLLKSSKSTTSVSQEYSAVQAPVYAAPIANRQEFIAAISACLAEELGTDISAIRIVSVKQL